MNQTDALIQENQDLRNRLSRLSQASIAINETLDFETVMQGVLDTARSLTDARYGMMTTVDELGWAKDFLTSGMASEERQRLTNAPGRKQTFEYFKGLRKGLRIDDLQSHLSSVGISYTCPLSVKFLLATPIRHQGESVGYILVGKRAHGNEFTQEDQETLSMFASQAAMVIANARKYRNEQRARADLETLIDTSPIGVVVFDVRTMQAVSVNREALRIFESLRSSVDCSQQLLEHLVIKRGNGRETSFKEFPLTWVLDAGETMRAEEIVFEGVDGESVTALVNATPITSEDGSLESIVVTLQDMTPLEELERLRAEFLAMVSHELRTPLSSVKGSVTTLLDRSVALNPTETVQFLQIIDVQAERMRELISDLLDVARIEMGMLSVSPEPADLAVLVGEAKNTFLSGSPRSNLQIELAQNLPWVMADRLRIVQVLNNLLANASEHSRESSDIRVAAVQDEFYVAITVSDKGSGVSAERLPHLFRKFSPFGVADPGRDITGSGLGLAICKGIVEAHGGRIWAESDGPGLGARFTFTIPVVEEEPSGVETASNGASKTVTEERARILAVDDDPQALRYIRHALSKYGYESIVTVDPDEAHRLIAKEKPHLALLDLMMPGTDGIELLARIRETTDLPVIFLSAYGQDQFIARAFDMGAADYVVKPFSPTELDARIRAALRKRETPEPSEPYVLDGLAINYGDRSVTLHGHPVQLTAIEYRLLVELSSTAGRVLTYQHLLQRVWGLGSAGDIRPMRTVISSLRRKLGDDANSPKYIFTEPRVGYRMRIAEKPSQTRSGALGSEVASVTNGGRANLVGSATDTDS